MVISEHEKIKKKMQGITLSGLNPEHSLCHQRSETLYKLVKLLKQLSNIIIGKLNNFTNRSHIADNHDKIENN